MGNSQLDDARTKDQQLENTCPAPCVEVRDAFESADTLYGVSAGLLIGGGAVGLATITYAIVAELNAAAPEDYAVVPLLGPTISGLAIHGSF